MLYIYMYNCRFVLQLYQSQLCHCLSWLPGMSAAGMLDLGGAHGAAAAANAITSNRFSYSMNLKAREISGKILGYNRIYTVANSMYIYIYIKYIYIYMIYIYNDIV